MASCLSVIVSLTLALTLGSDPSTWSAWAFQLGPIQQSSQTRRSHPFSALALTRRDDDGDDKMTATDNPILWCRRRVFKATQSAVVAAAATAAVGGPATWIAGPLPASAVGPTKINLLNPTYSAIPCPKDKPIPGEKAMKGMKGLCVTVNVDLEEAPPQLLEKAGVYGFIIDKGTGESVLANNPDLSTDAGQFAMIPEVKTTDKSIQFEFIAAVPREQDTTLYEEGIAPLDFSSLRVISYPGGQQYGAINPCEMNEFSDECEAWEAENGPYEKGDYMVRSNPRTKGR